MRRVYFILAMIFISNSTYADEYIKIPFRGCGTVKIIYHALSGEPLDPESFLKSLCGDKEWNEYTTYFTESDVFKRQEILDEVEQKLALRLNEFKNKKYFIYSYAVDMEPYSFDSKLFDITLRSSDNRPGHYTAKYSRYLDIDILFPKNKITYVPKNLEEAKLIENVTSKRAKAFTTKRAMPAQFYLEAIKVDNPKATCCGKNPGKINRIVSKVHRIDVVYPDYDQNGNLPEKKRILFSVDID
jgi:hypothetical protein